MTSVRFSRSALLDLVFVTRQSQYNLLLWPSIAAHMAF